MTHITLWLINPDLWFRAKGWVGVLECGVSDSNEYINKYLKKLFFKKNSFKKKIWKKTIRKIQNFIFIQKFEFKKE